MAETLAKGPQVAERVKAITILMPISADVGGGQRATIQPMTKYGSFIYVTSDGYNAYYIQGDELKAEKPSILFRNETVALMAHGGATAAWIIPVYRVMVHFMMAVVPGGRIVGAMVSAASTAAFFATHQKEIEEGLKEFKTLVELLQKLFKQCPRLGMAMLSVALQESSGKVSDEVKKKGFGQFVVDNLDWQTSAEEAAKLFGSLVKAACGGGSRIAGWLLKKGLLNLAKVTAALLKVYKVVKLARQAGKVPPGIDDKHALATKLLTAFAEAGVNMPPQEAAALVSEGCLNKPEMLKMLEELQTSAEAVEKIVGKLADAAEKEIF